MTVLVTCFGLKPPCADDLADYGPAMYMRKLKQPTGPTTPRRFRNGKFLMTVFADSQRFPDRAGFELRDPYWLVAGWEGEEALPGGGTRKTILWSQPEILLYALPPCEVRNPPHPPPSAL